MITIVQHDGEVIVTVNGNTASVDQEVVDEMKQTHGIDVIKELEAALEKYSKE